MLLTDIPVPQPSHLYEVVRTDCINKFPGIKCYLNVSYCVITVVILRTAINND